MAHEQKDRAEGAKKRAQLTAAKMLKDEAVRRALRKNHSRAREIEHEQSKRRLAAG